MSLETDHPLLRPTGKRFWKTAFIVVVIILLVLVGGWAVLMIDDLHTHQQVQQALDRDCGQGKASVQTGYFSYDPEFRWDSQNASCFTDITNGKFTCQCR